MAAINVVKEAEALQALDDSVREHKSVVKRKKVFIRDAKVIKVDAQREIMRLNWEKGKRLNKVKEDSEHGEYADLLKRLEWKPRMALNYRDLNTYFTVEQAQDFKSLRKAMDEVSKIKNPVSLPEKEAIESATDLEGEQADNTGSKSATESQNEQSVADLNQSTDTDAEAVEQAESTDDTPEQPDTESPDDSDTDDKGDVEPTDTITEAAEKSKQGVMIDDDLDIAIETHDGRSSGSAKKVVKSGSAKPAEQPAPPSKGDKVTLTLVFSDEYGDFLEESGEINRSDVEQMLARIKETDQDLFRLCLNFLKSIIRQPR